MANHMLEALEYKWILVRETSSSQKFLVEIGGAMDLKATFDIHYTRPVITTVSMCFIGPEEHLTDGLAHWLFFDLEKIIKRHGEYRIIDYSLVFSGSLFNGNYTISE